MLANGATLSVKAQGDSTFINLAGLKEIPDMGVEPEKVENTVLTDTVKQYENGIGDAGDMAYKFKFDNSGSSSAYRKLRAIESSGKAASFKEVLKDGTTTTFDAEVAVKRGGGGVNAALEFTASLSLQSAITIQDPTGASGTSN